MFFKKISIVLFSILIMVPSFAATINIENFTGSVINGSGKGSADRFDVNFTKVNTSSPIFISVVGNDLKLTRGIANYVWPLTDRTAVGLEEASWTNANLALVGNQVDVSFGSLNTQASYGDSLLLNLSATCTGTKKSFDTIVLYKSCFEKGHVTLSKYDSTPAVGEKTNLSNIVFNSVNGVFKASLKGKFGGMSAKVKISGEVDYLPAVNEIRVKINKAKASFLSVKAKLFKSIEAGRNPTVRVERPYIYFELTAP